MSHVLILNPSTSYLFKIEGNVSMKGGLLTIEATPMVIGGIKKVSKSFSADSVEAYRVGEKGFIVYRETSPLTKVYGKLLSSNESKIVIDTADGKVTVNNSQFVSASLIEADEDSKEAREAMRLGRSRVKTKEKTAAKAPAKKKKAK